MSSKSDSKDNALGEVALPVMIGIAVLTLFVASSGLLLGYAVSKKRDKVLNYTAPLSILVLLFIFWGVPYLYSPTWDSSEEFKDSYPNGKSYFLSMGEIKEKIMYEKRDIKELGEDVKREQKYNAGSDGYYTESIKKRKKEIDLGERNLSELTEIKRRINQRENNPVFFNMFINNQAEEYLVLHHEKRLKAYMWFVFSFLFALFVGRRSQKKPVGVQEKIVGVGGLIAIPGVVVAFIIRKIFKIEDVGSKNKHELTTENTFIFGNENGYLSDRNLALHTQVVGGSGVGKTNFLKNFIADRVGKGKGLIFLDFKADFEVLEWMQGLCFETQRGDFKVFTLSDSKNSVSYNPIEFGSATEICSQVMNSLIWSEEYYKNYSENALLMNLNLLCYLRDRDGERFHLGHLLKVLTNSQYRYHLLKQAGDYKFKDDLAELFSELDEKKSREKLSGLTIQLKKIIYSSAGDIFTENCEKFEPLKFREAIANGEVVYLYMNSMSLKEVASSAGKLILQDLMKEVGFLYDSQVKISENMSLVIDEFASFATPDFINFLDKARGAGIEVMIAHQSMSDLKEISDNFGIRILENTASKVVFNTQSSDDAEMFASIVGTYEDFEDTAQVSEAGLLGAIFGKSETGLGSRKTVEKFNIHPNTFKKLEQGEAVVMASKVDVHFGSTVIDRAPKYHQRKIEWEFISNRIENQQKYIDLNVSSELSINVKKKNEMNLSDGVDNI